MKKTTQSKKMNILLGIVTPLALVLIWLGLSGVGGPYFGKISDVSSNDQASFLPESADSTKVKQQIEKFKDQSSIPAIIVFESTDTDSLNKISQKLQEIPEITDGVSPPIVSDDNKASLVILPINADDSNELDPIFNNINQTINSVNSDIQYKIGGPASFSHDLISAFGGIDVTLLLVALSVVFVILLVVYRSPVLPIIVLLTAIFALSGAIYLVWHLANAGIVQINGQVQGILFILVIGAATDYSLLYLARLREELTTTKSKLTATLHAIKGSWEPIVAAGGTVIVSLLCLLLSDLGSNRALGPVGSIGIGFAILAALTFLPSALLLFGRSAFWPNRPAYKKAKPGTNEYQAQHRAWSKVGTLVTKHPRTLWISISLGLIVCCVGLLQLKASGVPQSELVVGTSEARDAQKIIDKHFPGGSGSPTYILARETNYRQVADKLSDIDGVTSLAVSSKDSPSGSIPITSDKKQAMFFARLEPTIHQDNVLLEATLRYAADSDAAQKLIPEIRASAESADSSALVGGEAAVQYDTNQTSIRDRAIIIPVILVAITIILMILLRSIIAPIVLLITTLLSFGAALGVAALVFNHLFGFVGADPAVILFGFVFLVALGIDYNIFLMTRVREETARSGVANGTIKALVVTGGVITSAGIVLAATFAALNVIPILFLIQIAFIVAFGVLLDTLIVRSLLVPSLTLEIGRFMWWPSKIFHKKAGKR